MQFNNKVTAYIDHGFLGALVAIMRLSVINISPVAKMKCINGLSVTVWYKALYSWFSFQFHFVMESALVSVTSYPRNILVITQQ